MTDSSIIQQARDMLAKWRDAAHHSVVGPWFTVYRNGVHLVDDPIEYGGYIADVEDEGVARLIALTAGNPDLLDAIDGLLADVLPFAERDQAGVFEHAERIAAAIVAANERMSA